MDFAALLQRERRRRRLSQAVLSGLSGVAQRHISFLETGRAQPGRQSVKKLAGALDLDYAAANAFYAAAGLTAPRAGFDWSSPAFDTARAAIGKVLARHSPWPALAADRAGYVLAANTGLDAVLDWAFAGADPWQATGCADRFNLHDLTFHPNGLVRFLTNPQEVLGHSLRRLETAARQCASAQEVLQRVRRHPAARLHIEEPEPADSRQASLVHERYCVRGQALDLVSMTAAFGSPEDVTAQNVRIELFLPANTGSEALLDRLVAERKAVP